MASLLPAGGDLIVTDEDVFVSETITADGFSAVEQWSYDITGIGQAPGGVLGVNFVIDEDGLNLHVSYVDFAGLFPLQHLDYLDPDGNRVRLTEGNLFDGLPSPGLSPEIVEMRADVKDVLEWELSVVASGLDAAMAPVEASETYILRVFANYNGNRDNLTGAVDARR